MFWVIFWVNSFACTGAGFSLSWAVRLIGAGTVTDTIQESLMINFEHLQETRHEQVVLCSDSSSGLRAIIAIHNTILGPALGGCRMWTYENDEAALRDVLRLSEGMTRKAAVAGLNLGGGKTVIIGDPKKDKSEALFRSLGRYIETLNGRYITAEDVGTNVDDMEYIFMETNNVVGVAQVHGGSGDPSPFTAFGVYCGIQACLDLKTDKKKIKDVTVAVQGVGHVGYHLVKYLRRDGAHVMVTDIDLARCEAVRDELGAEIVKPDEIFDVPCDIFAPCAMGAVVNHKTIDRLKCPIIAGAANNQLESIDIADELRKREILYAPDYAINAGGLMNVSIELDGYDETRARRMVSKVYDNLMTIFNISRNDNIPTARAADLLADRRIQAIGKMKQTYIGRVSRPRFQGRIQNPQSGGD